MVSLLNSMSFNHTFVCCVDVGVCNTELFQLGEIEHIGLTLGASSNFKACQRGTTFSSLI